MVEIRTEMQEWIRRRVDEVRSRYTAYDCLVEHGHSEQLADPDTAVQMFCPVHSNVNTMAARYYPSTGNRPAHVHCWSCRESWDGIALYMKFTNQRFMDALVALERRLGVKVPKRPDPPPIADPVQRTSGYISERWSDIAAVLSIMEGKLSRVRDKCAMSDYVKFCRVIDAVTFDFDKTHIATEEMARALARTMVLMDEAMIYPDFGLEI